MKMSTKVPPPVTWHICEIIIDFRGHVVSTCILNLSRGHEFLNDALNFAISINLKFKL